jgi:hypothetical protein
VVRVNEGNKLRIFVIRSFHQFTLTVLFSIPITLCFLYVHQIPQYEHILHILALKVCGIDFQTMEYKKFLCSLFLHCANMSTLEVKQKTHTDKISLDIYNINIHQNIGIFYLYNFKHRHDGQKNDRNL